MTGKIPCRFVDRLITRNANFTLRTRSAAGATVPLRGEAEGSVAADRRAEVESGIADSLTKVGDPL